MAQLHIILSTEILQKLFLTGDKAETAGYIQSQLCYAGVERDLFADAAIQEIYLYFTGVPRLVNKLCTNCLLYGATGKHRIIDDHMVRLVIEGEMS